MTEKDLADRLVLPHDTLDDFAETADASLDFVTGRQALPATTAGRSHYELWSVNVTGQSRKLRPVNTSLFIGDQTRRSECLKSIRSLLDDLANNRGPSPTIVSTHSRTIEEGLIGQVLYTLQQAYGIACDAVLPGNTSRKHVGMKFESLIKATLNELKIANKSLTFRVEQDYKAEVDCVMSPFCAVKSNSHTIDKAEVLASIKTTSKDRMPKVFIDRMLLEKVLSHEVKVTAIFQNDVQRKGKDQVSGTFVANLFLVYSRHLRPLDGVYFCDPPAHIADPAWSPFIKHIDDLFLADVWKLLDLSN